MPIATVNPATGETIKVFQPLSDAAIEKKLQLAVTVFKSERQTPFAVRAQRMRKAAEILERDKEKFAHLMTLEMGKTYKSALAEAVKCTTACRYYAENAEKFLADEVVDTGAKKSFIRYMPIGPGCDAVELSLSRPILNFQPSHPSEFVLIVGDQRKPRSQSVCRDPEVVGADHLASAFEFGPDKAVDFSCLLIEGQRRHQLEKLAEGLKGRPALRALVRAV